MLLYIELSFLRKMCTFIEDIYAFFKRAIDDYEIGRATALIK